MPAPKPPKKGDAIGRAWSKRATKVYLLVNEQGLPVALGLAAANIGEVKACVPVARQVPSQSVLSADRVYDVPRFRQWLRHRKIYPLIRGKKIWMSNQQAYRLPKPLPSALLYRERYKVERAFAWFEKFKRLNIRYERLAYLYQALWHLAAAVMLCDAFTR
jgi:transposase